MNYLTDRMQYAEVNGECSSMKEVMLGVHQRSSLGPKLCCIHVNYLPLAITQGEVYLYADDTTFSLHSQRCRKCCRHTELYVMRFA